MLSMEDSRKIICSDFKGVWTDYCVFDNEVAEPGKDQWARLNIRTVSSFPSAISGPTRINTGLVICQLFFPGGTGYWNISEELEKISRIFSVPYNRGPVWYRNLRYETPGVNGSTWYQTNSISDFNYISGETLS